MDIFQEASKSDLAHCFVPEILTNYIKKNVKQGHDKIEPTSFFIKGVCLLVDISGFTMMSEQFCVQGKSGIDGLQLTTNGYMGKLVEVIYQFGGDIIKFAGDAVVCVFASEKFEEENEIPVDVILRAMHCARVIREVRTDTLTVHVAMSCGEMCFGILGGFENRWECLISGPCIHQLSDGLDDAPSMQSVLSPECAEILHRHATSTSSLPPSPTLDLPSTQSTITTTNGVYQYQLAALPSGNCRIIEITLSVTEVVASVKTLLTRRNSLVSSRQTAQIDSLIRLFVPAPIGEELDNATGLTYFSEIREVATMFMKWDSYDANGKHRDLLDLQACFYQAQRILQSTGAYLRQFLVDDKGCVLIACWGMPNMSYVDNCYRAMSAAAQMQGELSRLGMQTSVGITVGDVYCGTVGSARRMEYAAIACCVNMAARLMGKAKGRLIIGQSAYMRLPKSAHALLEALEPMMVKGKATPLQAYSYIATSSAGSGGDGGVGVGSGKTAAKSLATELGNELSETCRAALMALLNHLSAAQGSGSVDAEYVSTANNSTANTPKPVHSNTATNTNATNATTATNTNTTTCDPTAANCVDCNVPTTTTTTTAPTKTNAPTNTSASVQSAINKNKKSSWFGFPSFASSKFGDQMAVLLISGNEGSGRTSAVSWLKDQALQRHIPTHSLRTTKKDCTTEYALFRRLFALCMPKDLFLSADIQRAHVRSLLCKVFSPMVAEHQAFGVLREVLGVTCSYHDPTVADAGGSALLKKNLTKGTWSRSMTLSAHMLDTHTHVSPHEILLQLFTYLLTTTPTLLIVEHVENVDNESLALLVELMKLRTHSSLVLTTLKINTTVSKKRVGGFLLTKKYTLDAAHSTPWHKIYHNAILKHKYTTSVVLENYTYAEISTMLTKALGSGVDSDMAQLVQEFSGGSCFWVREIIQCIVDNGREQFMSAVHDGTNSSMGISGTLGMGSTSNDEMHHNESFKSHTSGASAGLDQQGSIRLKPTNRTPTNAANGSSGTSTRRNKHTNKPTLLTTVPFHETDTTHSQAKLDKLVLCRLNNLTSDIQRVLRSASIIGMNFSAKVLYAVLPKHLKDCMSTSIDTLLRHKWLYQDVECDTNYRFAHSHAHRVIYQLTPLSERNMLHMAIADHIVEHYTNDESQYAAVCYHYQHCCSDKALQYAIKATNVMLTTNDIFEYGDCMEILYGTFPCVQTTYDVEVLMRLVQQVAVGIQKCNTAKMVGTPNSIGKFFTTLYHMLVGSGGSGTNSTKLNCNCNKVVPIDATVGTSDKGSISIHNTTNTTHNIDPAIDKNVSSDVSITGTVDLFNHANTPYVASDNDKLYTIPTLHNTLPHTLHHKDSSSRYETETDDGESDLDPTLDAVDIETRTKRGFLSQLERLNDQLCSKQAQLRLMDERNGISGGGGGGDGVCVVLPDWEKSYLGI